MNKLFDTFTWKINETGLAEQRSKEHISKYGNGIATMHEPTIKAILHYATVNKSYGCIAIGTSDSNVIVEDNENGTARLVIFSETTKRFMASNYKNGLQTPYKLAKNADDGSSMLLAMMPKLMEDDEFAENYKVISDLCEFQPDMESVLKEIQSDENAKNALFILCDNVYRRVNKGDLCTVSNSGNISPISQLSLSQGIYTPTDVIGGTFKVFTATTEKASIVDTNSFSGKYHLDDSRIFTELEKSLIPELPAWYIVPQYLVSACKMVTSKLARPVRNILFRGEAGTRKTEAAKALASALNLPYVSICCHPDMQITDFTGSILPKLETSETTDKLPTFNDIAMNVDNAYEMLTGETAPENITGNDVMNLLVEKVKANSNGIQYSYYDSELVRAIKYGWVCEIQEPAIIERPGVLTGLNSLLDTCQQVTLPTGEVIKRHPDCIIVVTTNTNYAGCKDINNSVLSRMQFKKDTEMPSESELKERITGITGFSDDTTLSEMIKVVNEIHRFCQERMITDGSCGVRELIDWVQSYMILGNILESAELTIIPSASADLENQEQIKISCLNTHFTA